MEIGEVKRTRIIEPLENPAQRPKPVEDPRPVVAEPDREKVPA